MILIYTVTLFKIKKKELQVLSLFHHNHSSLAVFAEGSGQKAAKTAQKVQVNYSYMMKQNLWREIQIGKFF